MTHPMICSHLPFSRFLSLSFSPTQTERQGRLLFDSRLFAHARKRRNARESLPHHQCRKRRWDGPPGGTHPRLRCQQGGRSPADQEISFGSGSPQHYRQRAGTRLCGHAYVQGIGDLGGYRGNYIQRNSPKAHGKRRRHGRCLFVFEFPGGSLVYGRDSERRWGNCGCPSD